MCHRFFEHSSKFFLFLDIALPESGEERDLCISQVSNEMQTIVQDLKLAGRILNNMASLDINPSYFPFIFYSMQEEKSIEYEYHKKILAKQNSIYI